MRAPLGAAELYREGSCCWRCFALTSLMIRGHCPVFPDQQVWARSHAPCGGALQTVECNVVLFPEPPTGTAALFPLSAALASPADSTTSEWFSPVCIASIHEAAPNELPTASVSFATKKLPSLLSPFNPWNEYAAVHISLPPAHIRVRNFPLLPKILTCSFTNRMD